MLALGIALFLAPTTFAPLWPWQLTALTARAIGVWLIALGMTTLQADWENDWLRNFAASVSSIALGVLELAALARFSGSVDWGKTNTWIYSLFVSSILAMGVYGLWSARRAGQRS
jgi:hypothetical protein